MITFSWAYGNCDIYIYIYMYILVQNGVRCVYFNFRR